LKKNKDMRSFFTIANIFLLSNILFSQDLSLTEKRRIRENVFTLLTEYNYSAGFRELGRSSISPSEIEKFRKLFTKDATIFDPINPELVYDTRGIGNYQFREKPLEEYVGGIVQYFPQALDVTMTNISLDFDSAQYGRIRVLVEKQTKGEHQLFKGRFSSIDTSLLILQLNKSFDDPKIVKISRIGNSLAIHNDLDLDGIVDSQDKCPGIPGPPPTGCPPSQGDEIYADRDDDGVPDRLDKCPDIFGIKPHGCPDTDGDGFADHIDKCPEVPGKYRGCHPDFQRNQLTVWTTGGANNIRFGSSELIPLGYESLVNERSRYSPLGIDSMGSTFRFGFGAEWDMYLFVGGKVGVSLGVHYQEYSSSATMEEFVAEYQSRDAAGDPYRRILTISDLTEDLKAGYLTLPLLFKFRHPLPFNDKFALFLHAGPALSIQFINRGTAKATGDYEAVYHYSTNGFEFNLGRGNWELTRERIQRLAGSEQGMMDYFESRGPLFDIALDEKLESKPSLQQTIGVGGLIRAGITYRIQERLFINVGGQMFFSQINSRPGSDFKLSDKVGELNSLFSGLDYEKAKLSNLGFSIGIAFGLNN
jgi:hypothetical protein